MYGVLAGSFGVGAILGAVVQTGRLDGRRPPSTILDARCRPCTRSVCLALGLAPTFGVAVVVLAGVVGGFSMMIATNNSCIQHRRLREPRFE